MKITFKILAGLAFLSAASSLHAAITLVTVGVYDSNNNSNVVDRTAIGNVGTFTTAVSSAFGANLGGVITFDGVGSNNSVTDIDASYGGAKTLRITTGQQFNTQFSNNIRAISGTENAGTGNFLFDSTAAQITTYTFGPITGGISGEAVTQLGFTILTRNGGGAPTITATATYSNATTQSGQASFTSTTTPDQDTFYGFTAPTGFSITGFTINYGAAGDLRRGIDDLGFITSAVPEPSTYALLGVGFVGLIVLRKLRPRNVS